MTTRQHNVTRRRGSILLMVVGMITIVAMLGAVFLLVSRHDASQSVATVTRSQTDPVVSGIIARAAAAIAEDRWCDASSGPYGNMASGEWQKFIDYPHQGGPGDDDYWLTDVIRLPHSTAFSRLLGLGYAVNIATGEIGGSESDAFLVDTGMTDPQGNKFHAAIKITDVSSRLNLNTAGRGRPGDDNDPAKPDLPDRVNLQGFLLRALLSFGPADTTVPNPTQISNAAAAYAAVHTMRSGGIAAVPLSDYTPQAGMRLMNPAFVGGKPQALPFSVNDEIWLLCPPAPGVTAVNRGRFYDLCAANPATIGAALALTPDARRMLTTWNASMQGLRDLLPSGDTARMNFWTLNETTNDITFVYDAAARDRFYEKLCGLLDPDGLDEAGRITAAHLVANLWAYCEGDLKKAHYYRPPAGGVPETENFAAYGMKPQLAISEVAMWKRAETVYHEFDYLTDPGNPDPGPPISSDDGGWFYAVEIFNPTDAPIAVLDGTTPIFIVRMETDTTSTNAFTWLEDDGVTPILTTLGPGERVVLYNFDGERLDLDALANGDQPPLDDDKLTDRPITIVLEDNDEFAKFFFGVSSESALDGAPRAIRWKALTGSFGAVELLRKAEGHDILLDRISDGDNPGWNPTVGEGADGYGEEKGAGAERGDNPARQQALVAVYKTWATGPDTRTDALHTLHTLRKANSDTSTTAAFADIWHGFDVTLSGTSMVSLGELGRLWLTGPRVENLTGGTPAKILITEELKTAAFNTPSQARVDFTGPVSTIGKYPAVPWACLLGELFDCVPSDPTPAGAPRHEKTGRVYARININTAPKEVLRQLPWPDKLTLGGTELPLNDPTIAPGAPGYKLMMDNMEELLDHIIAYREGGDNTVNSITDVPHMRSFANRNAIGIPGGLRGGVGYLTPGELALVLNDYVNLKADWADYAPATATVPVSDPTYLDERNRLYQAVANLITVNSDVFDAAILVQLRDRNTNAVKHEWRYVVLFDRGNCMKPGDRPVVLMMSEVK